MGVCIYIYNDDVLDMRKPSIKNYCAERAEKVLNNIQQTEKKNELPDGGLALYAYIYIYPPELNAIRGSFELLISDQLFPRSQLARSVLYIN